MLLGVAILFAASRLRHSIVEFLVVCLLVWSIGAVFNYVLMVYFDVGTMRAGNSEVTIWTLIAGGAPDINDSMHFLSRFMNHPQYSLGRNIIGGLMPNQYKWNPGLWSLSVAREMTREEVVNFAAGGLRLAIPVTGFASFDWLGVNIISFGIGFATGYIVAFARRHVAAAPVEVKSVVLIVAWCLIGNLDAPTWHLMTPLLMLAPLIYPMRFRLLSSTSQRSSIIAGAAT